MLSVYVPPASGPNQGKMPGAQYAKKPQAGNAVEPTTTTTPDNSATQQPGVSGWLNKVLTKGSSVEDAPEMDESESEMDGPDVEESDADGVVPVEADEGSDAEAEVVDLDAENEDIAEDEIEDVDDQDKRKNGKKKRRSRRSKKKRMKEKITSTKDRIRNLAAAASVLRAHQKELEEKESTKRTLTAEQKSEAKARRNLQRLHALSRSVPIQTPSDPVRGRTWKAWIEREIGSVIFRTNRRALNVELTKRKLSIAMYTGTKGVGSALRQMLSVRDLSTSMGDLVRTAVEIEAAKSAKHGESPWHDESTINEDIRLKDFDRSLDQLIEFRSPVEKGEYDTQYLHPSSLESAISLVCNISPSPSGGVPSSSPITGASGVASHHVTKEDLAALASDKHEKALISQVVLPGEIGVSYDMIGGLADVKELLRQSITYPLKYPHLYSEGIAREAVKGVLLFGPPGEKLLLCTCTYFKRFGVKYSNRPLTLQFLSCFLFRISQAPARPCWPRPWLPKVEPPSYPSMPHPSRTNGLVSRRRTPRLFSPLRAGSPPASSLLTRLTLF